jgi:hypothetical protein
MNVFDVLKRLRGHALLAPSNMIKVKAPSKHVN